MEGSVTGRSASGKSGGEGEMQEDEAGTIDSYSEDLHVNPVAKKYSLPQGGGTFDFTLGVGFWST